MSYRRFIRAAKVTTTWSVILLLGLNPAFAGNCWSSFCGSFAAPICPSVSSCGPVCPDACPFSDFSCDATCEAGGDVMLDSCCGGGCEIETHACVDCGAVGCSGCVASDACGGGMEIINETEGGVVTEPGRGVPMEVPNEGPAPPVVTPVLPDEPDTTAPTTGNEAPPVAVPPIVPTPPNTTEPDANDLFSEPETTEPDMTEPAPETPATETPADDNFGDLFGGDSGADDATAPSTPPATDFPAAEEPAAEEPATEEPASGGFDDLFDSDAAADSAGAVEPATTEQPVTEEPAGDDAFGDLFGSEPATAPPATETPATETPATETPATEGGFDDLFDSTPADAAPADGPASTDKQPTGSDSLDDLFGKSSSGAEQVQVAVQEPVRPAQRTWIDNTGRYETVGELVLITDSYIRLLKSNGRHCTVPMRRLSESDATYVAQMREQWRGTDLIQLAGTAVATH